MDFQYSLSDPLTITIVGICFSICALLIKELILYLRDVIPCSVQCWFCHFRTRVHYKSSNSWICPECDQYNGFTKDGNYNKDILSQHNSKLNNFIFTYRNPAGSFKTKNKLCSKCNLKQQLKVQQLASFVPMNEKNYDREVEHFREQLEKGYELCQNCEILVSKVLQNLREELSLPKRLTAAVLKVNIRGERAICINIILSILLAFTSFRWEMPYEEIKSSFINVNFPESWNIVFNHPWYSTVLMNSEQILIGSGIFINSIAFYQTNSPMTFLNIISWVLMFFLTLYPDGYEELVNILKVASSFVSVTVSIIILLKNLEKKNKKKTSLWEKKKTSKMPTMTPPMSPISRIPSPGSCNVSQNNSSTRTVLSDDSPISISSSLSNLSLGVKQRREIKRPINRPVITPPKFNPFIGSPSEKNYQMYGKPGPCTFTHYEPSLTPPSMFDGYDSTEHITTIPSYSCQQSYIPYTPTLAYYFTTHPYSTKMMPVAERFPLLDPCSYKKEQNYFWMFIQSVPTIALVICNLVIIYSMYFKPKDLLRN